MNTETTAQDMTPAAKSAVTFAKRDNMRFGKTVEEITQGWDQQVADLARDFFAAERGSDERDDLEEELIAALAQQYADRDNAKKGL